MIEFDCVRCHRKLSLDPAVSSDAWCARCSQYRAPADVPAFARAKADAKRLFNELGRAHSDVFAIEAALASINRSTAAVLSELATAIQQAAANSSLPIRRRNQNGYKRKNLGTGL